MKVITNEKIIRRNSRIGQISTIAALVILAAGAYISFVYPDQFNLSAAALLVGFILSQVGIYFGNRWGRHPRADERLIVSLKGLTKDYTLYNFVTPVNHLLVGPAGVWIIESYYQRGKIVYEGKKWRQKGGGFMLNYLKIFAQESLGRPDLEAQADLDSLAGALKKTLGEDVPPINVALVFTDDRAELQAETAPLPTMMIKDLKDFLRQYAKSHQFSAAQIQRVTGVLPTETQE